MFMPVEPLDLGRALLCRWHLMTRLTRNMLYFSTLPHPQAIIDGCTLTQEQTTRRKYFDLINNDVITKSFLDFNSLASSLRFSLRYQLCPCNPTCPWNDYVAQMVFHIWEMIQAQSMTQTWSRVGYNYALSVCDFRMTGK